MRRRSWRNMRRGAGFSLVEMLIALAIVALLLTATMLAIHASFRAYAVAAESASTQSASRLVVHRLLTMVRTSTAHGPLDEQDAEQIALDLNAVDGLQVTLADLEFSRVGDELRARVMVLQDQSGRLVAIYYDKEAEELWLVENLGQSDADAQPLLAGVEKCQFYLRRRIDNNGMYMLQRGALEMRVRPDKDNTLPVESGNTPAIELVASTMPRRLFE